MSGVKRILKYTIQHLSRNRWQSVSVVLIMAVTMLVGQLFAVVMIGSQQVLRYFENQPQVTVFFKDEAQPDQIMQIKKELEKDSLIEEVAYISKEQAVEIYRAQQTNDPELLEFVTADILPASLEISSSEPTHLAQIADQFRNNQFVEQVIFQQDLVDELLSWTAAIRMAGLAFLIVQAVVLAVLITMVVTGSIAAFSKEIEIMRLVGAGSWYIRWPFILDGIFFAIISAGLATGGLWWLLPKIESFTNSFIATGVVFPNGVITLSQFATGAALVGGVFTTIVSSLVVWRYLRK